MDDEYLKMKTVKKFIKSEIEVAITKNTAAWCAFSSTRSGCPLKSKKVLYPIIDKITFDVPLDEKAGAITKKEFNKWHEDQCNFIAILFGINPTQIGWAPKIINIYRKNACFIGGIVRENLPNLIHPPIDGILVEALKNKISLKIPYIKNFNTYNEYITIIASLEKLSEKEGIKLIEVEKYLDPRM